MKLPSRDHPVWNLLRLVVIMTTLYAVLKMNASNFDFTEIKSVIMMFFAMLGAEGITALIPKKHLRNNDCSVHRCSNQYHQTIDDR